MAGKIFINYRRDDAPDVAARIHDRLAPVFGDANIFMDVDKLRPGQRFDEELKKALAETDVFLAVIGPHWTRLLAERQASPTPDYVRDEIQAALARGVIVIPVLINRTLLPGEADVPQDIRKLLLHQTLDVSSNRLRRDVDELVEAIKERRRARQTGAKKPHSPRTINWKWTGSGTAIVVTIALGAAFFKDPVSLPGDRTPPHFPPNSRSLEPTTNGNRGDLVEAALQKREAELLKRIELAAAARASAEDARRTAVAEAQRQAELAAVVMREAEALRIKEAEAAARKKAADDRQNAEVEAQRQAALAAAAKLEVEAKQRAEAEAAAALLVRSIQSELARVGCDPGDIDGKWGTKAREALGKFRKLAGVNLKSDEPSEAAREALASQSSAICLPREPPIKDAGAPGSSRPSKPPPPSPQQTPEPRQTSPVPRTPSTSSGGGGTSRTSPMHGL